MVELEPTHPKGKTSKTKTHTEKKKKDTINLADF